jgi:hypothetical protein
VFWGKKKKENFETTLQRIKSLLNYFNVAAFGSEYYICVSAVKHKDKTVILPAA